MGPFKWATLHKWSTLVPNSMVLIRKLLLLDANEPTNHNWNGGIGEGAAVPRTPSLRPVGSNLSSGAAWDFPRRHLSTDFGINSMFSKRDKRFCESTVHMWPGPSMSTHQEEAQRKGEAHTGKEGLCNDQKLPDSPWVSLLTRTEQWKQHRVPQRIKG